MRDLLVQGEGLGKYFCGCVRVCREWGGEIWGIKFFFKHLKKNLHSGYFIKIIFNLIHTNIYTHMCVYVSIYINICGTDRNTLTLGTSIIHFNSLSGKPSSLVPYECILRTFNVDIWFHVTKFLKMTDINIQILTLIIRVKVVLLSSIFKIWVGDRHNIYLSTWLILYSYFTYCH